MSEMQSGKTDREQSQDLDARLGAYYGPPLREYPLPASSWPRVRARLGRRCVSPRSILQRWQRRRFTGRPTIPFDVMDAFKSVQDAAHLYYPSSLLSCAFISGRSEPGARVTAFGRHRIKLRLPWPREYTLQRSELHVLVATGLAYYYCLYRRRLSYTLILVCAMVLALLACAGAAVGLLLHLYVCFVLLLALPAIAWGLHNVRRGYAMQADALMVQWLGRSQVCQGLHLLASHSATASHKRWGQLSLAERIERICGTAVEERDERLTLVR